MQPFIVSKAIDTKRQNIYSCKTICMKLLKRNADNKNDENGKKKDSHVSIHK